MAAGSSAGSIFVDLLLRDAKLQEGFRRAGRSSKSTFNSIKKDGLSASNAISFAWKNLGSIIGLTSVGAVFSKFIRNTIDAQNEQAQLAAVIRSTGNAAGYTVKQLNDMSRSLSQNSIFSEGQITNAQTRLLSYSGILSENIPRAMQATIDQSARLGISLEQSAEIIGRALESPSKAAAALSRQGFGAEFTDEVIGAIKALEAQGREAEAQAVVLGILEKSYGDAAKAARDTLGGALTGLGNAINVLLTSDGAFPGLQKALNATSGFIIKLADDTNILETAAFGWVSILQKGVELYYRQSAINAGKFNPFGIRDSDIERYTDIANKAADAQERLAVELLNAKKAREAAKPKRDDSGVFVGGTIPDLSDLLDPDKGKREAEKRQRELESIYQRNRQLILGLDNATLRYNDTIEELNELLEAGKITQDEYSGAINRAQEEFDNAREKGIQFAFDTEAATKRAAENIQDSFADFLFDPFDKGLDGMLQGFANTLRRMAAEAASARILDSLFGKSGAFGNVFGDLGNLFSVDGARAIGGGVAAGNLYRVGENGEELFRPSTSGTIIPNHAIPQGGGAVVNIINNNGSNITTRQGTNGADIDVIIDQAVANNISTPGSRTNQALNNYSSRGLVRR